MAEKFGIMSQAYFKGKRELLEWISSFLEMDIPKVEVLASGAHYCQLLDVLYPGSIKMRKVNFGAYLEVTYLQNWKLVQSAFGKHNIQKIIPVQRLVRARFQDNLEFLQWFHQFFVHSYQATEEYNPVDRRKLCKWANRQPGRKNKRRRENEDQSLSRKHRNKENRCPRSSLKSILNGERKKLNSLSNVTFKANNNEKLKNEVQKLKEEKASLKRELDRISSTAKAIESERDFYFKVLLKVETMCKNSKNRDSSEIKKIMEVLYASNDEAGKDKGGEQSVDQEQGTKSPPLKDTVTK